MDILQSFNGGKHKNFISVDMTDAHFKKVQELMPKGVKVRVVEEAKAGTAVAKPVSNFTSLKMTFRKKLTGGAYSPVSYLDAQYCKEKVTNANLDGLAPLMEDGVGTKADMSSILVFKETK